MYQAVRKLNEAKKLESSAHYNADFGKEWGRLWIKPKSC